MFVTFLKYSSR